MVQKLTGASYRLYHIDEITGVYQELGFGGEVESIHVTSEECEDDIKYLNLMSIEEFSFSFEVKKVFELKAALDILINSIKSLSKKEGFINEFEKPSRLDWPDAYKKFSGYSYRPSYSRRCHHRNSRR